MRQLSVFKFFLLVIILFNSCDHKVLKSPINEYIKDTKHQFSYQIVDSILENKWTGYHVKMVSGNWLSEKFVDEVQWWHYVDIVVPKNIETNKALMFIDGGTKNEKYFRLDSTSISLAIDTKSIIANVSNIPFQPINYLESDKDEYYEDDLIAYAWKNFLNRGAKNQDVEWLPRLPMTRAVVRAMDLVQEVSLSKKIDVESFIVSGASKRGWTAWTVAAFDERVEALAPMVIDMLNLLPSFESHYRSYGNYSYAVKEYVDHNIPNWMGSKEFEKLLAIVEPFSFKEKFQMPKYIINAASDEFFVTDSWRFYYNELPGIKLLRYIPNVNHSLDGRYLSNNLIGFYKRIISNETFPDVYWKLENDSIHVNVKSDEKYLVSLWIANNENGRDFRLSEKGQLWRKIEIKNNNIGNYKAKLNNGLKGYTAIMFEFIFKPESKYPLIVTTGPYVTPHSYPYQKEKLDKVYGDH